MLELGKPGSRGAKGEVPVLRDGEVVATLRASNWKESASATVDGREWHFAKRRRELTGARTTDPQGTVRLTARQTSLWRGSWRLDLEGMPVEMRTTSAWKGTHAYTVGDRRVAENVPRGGWSWQPRTAIESPSLPLDHQVFLLWFELVVNRRNSAAMTAVVAGGVVGGSS